MTFLFWLTLCFVTFLFWLFTLSCFVVWHFCFCCSHSVAFLLHVCFIRHSLLLWRSFESNQKWSPYTRLDSRPRSGRDQQHTNGVSHWFLTTIDNNRKPVERRVNGLCLGRCNWLFFLQRTWSTCWKQISKALWKGLCLTEIFKSFSVCFFVSALVPITSLNCFCNK